MKQFREQLQLILDKGTRKTDRTGTGTISHFGLQARYDLSEGFPLVTAKKTFLKGIIGELLWFLEGSTNAFRLEEITFGTRGERDTIWSEWQDENGDLGPVYGAQWRNFGGIDQITRLISDIKRNPDSRRHIVSAWDASELDNMALPPCHTLWQVFIADGKMSLQLYQRSADMFLGVPFNIASYALLTMMLAQVTGYEPGEFIHTIGDAHIYLNHMDQVEEYLSRDVFPLPQMKINKTVNDIFSFTMSDFELVNYQSHPTIKAPVAV